MISKTNEIFEKTQQLKMRIAKKILQLEFQFRRSA